MGTYAGVGTKVLIPVFSLYVRSYGVIGDQAGRMKQWRDINKKTAGATPAAFMSTGNPTKQGSDSSDEE